MPSSTATPETLITGIPNFFQEAQHSIANHRKNAVALHRIHAQCSTFTQETPRGTKLLGEKAFNTAFLQCINHVLVIKKGVTQADRALKFVAAYAAYAQAQFRKDAGQPANEDEEEEDTPATRFVTILLKHAIKGFSAKNKNVRLRCCQTVALLVNGLESMDDDLYQVLLEALLIRIRDKEVPVRVQAVVALSKLQSGDDDEADQTMLVDEDEEDEQVKGIRSHLLGILRTDPSAEARRAALFNLPINDSTLPYILERLRDTDAVNRRCVYLGSLTTGLARPGSSQLSPEQSHQVVKVGLGEREESVRKACGKLINAWVDRDGADPIKLVDRFDGLTYAESTMSALKAAFETRPALLDAVAFDDTFWNQLTPNTALLARSVVEYLKSKGRAGEARLEEVMPLVMALAFRVQGIWSSLIELLTTRADEEEAEDMASSQASVLESLMHIALNSDYGDEIGRRKMFGLIREMISHESLPTNLIEPCIDVLLKLSAGQRDFVRIVVEIVQELADEEEDEDEEGGDAERDQDADDSAEVEDLVQSRRKRSRSGENAANAAASSERKNASDNRRLLLVRAMLERMASNLHENTAIHGLIPQLIAPAVKSKDASVREQGLFCLGLCCLLDSKLALDTFPLFLDQIQRADGAIKLRATQVVFDQMLVHGIPYLSSRQAAAAGGGPDAAAMAYSQIIGFLLGLLEDDEEQIQAVAAEGIAKLMLSGMVDDDEALRSLVLVYMSPETQANQEMRQCLSYFLPVYCFSSSTNQRRLQRVLLPVLQVLTEVYHEIAGSQEMVTPAQVGAQLVDWSDPSKAINLASPQDRCIHFDVALELLQTLLTSEDKEERKVLVGMLGKLSLPEAEHLDMPRGKTFFLLAAKLREVNAFEETTVRNSFAKFEASCIKKYTEQATAAREADLESDADLEKLRSFLEGQDLELALDDPGAIANLDAADEAKPKRGAAGRATSSAPRSTSSAKPPSGRSNRAISSSKAPPKPAAAPLKATTSKRTVSAASSRQRSKSVSDDDEDDDESDEEEESDDDDDEDGGALRADDDSDEDELAM
ncbi:ARM repeat-containing protein [Jaminaea rosea]|uniref:ARM repeat-containing protein n=1 Tax=Jaminaea rosea TaxID=1569628 RepID=A0A316UZT5_9BASI|nr:ARM repeat-containing protein [Jaminaea rosea]PWN30817.1 ARM repeat-containing protein [Jaminaea rosea]